MLHYSHSPIITRFHATIAKLIHSTLNIYHNPAKPTIRYGTQPTVSHDLHEPTSVFNVLRPTSGFQYPCGYPVRYYVHGGQHHITDCSSVHAIWAILTGQILVLLHKKDTCRNSWKPLNAIQHAENSGNCHPEISVIAWYIERNGPTIVRFCMAHMMHSAQSTYDMAIVAH